MGVAIYTQLRFTNAINFVFTRFNEFFYFIQSEIITASSSGKLFNTNKQRNTVNKNSNKKRRSYLSPKFPLANIKSSHFACLSKLMD